MVKLFFILGSALLSCGSTKTTQTTEKKDTAIIVQETVLKDSIPACIRAKVDSFKKAQPHDQPQRVVEYQYKGKKVYYIVMPCCDFFNEVYDDKCKMIGSPDGGFTGKGDGRLPDFFTAATKEKLIWELKKN